MYVSNFTSDSSDDTSEIAVKLKSPPEYEANFSVFP